MASSVESLQARVKDLEGRLSERDGMSRLQLATQSCLVQLCQVIVLSGFCAHELDFSCICPARIAALETAVTVAEAAAMPQVLLKCDRSEAVIFLHGAHVTSWKVRSHRCLL